MALTSYPFHFVQKFELPRTGTSNDFMLYKLLYSFTSPKSHQAYWVWVEVYENDFYAVKFHLKAHRDSPKKYQIMTGLGEPRPVVNTCVNIMLQIASMNEKASFGFIGAHSENEEEGNTKRFRFYRHMMSTYFSKTEFKHFIDAQRSTYMLARKRVLESDPEILRKVEQGFAAMYDYFE